MNTALERARSEVDRLARTIGAPSEYFPAFGSGEGWSARPHIEHDGMFYHYVVIERDDELRRNTGDLDYVLELAFQDITAAMARSASQGAPCPRETMFQHQLELLSKLNSTWRDHRAAAIEDILKRYPLVHGT